MELTKEQEKDWNKVVEKLTEISGKKPKDINVVLFLIGVRELGKGVRNFSKEEKQDLMHIAICRLLKPGGYYEFEGFDQDGWPHWKKKKELPYHNLQEQVLLLRSFIIDYFYDEGLIEDN